MTEWREITLGDVVTVKHGYAFKGEFFAPEGDEIVLTPGNFPVGGGLQFRPGKERYYAGSFPPEFRLKSGDLLVVMTDLKQDAPILGSPAVVPPSPAVLHNQRLGLVAVKDATTVDRRFLYYMLLSDHVRSQLRATATGTTVRHTAPERIYRVRAALPPVPVQRTIGKVLGAIDDLIENNGRRIELLEQMAQAIYREWFVRFRFPGHEDATFVDSLLGPIPKGWEVAGLETVVAVAKSTVDSSTMDPATPAVGLEHIPRRQLTLDDWGTAGELTSRKGTFKTGDVLFGKIRPYFHKVSVAPFDGICSTDAIVIRPIEDYWGVAVMTVFSDEFVAYAIQTSNGTKMPRADWKVLKDFPVAMPPADVARRFTDVTRDSLGTAQRLMLANRELAAIRDLLLPRLVTGQIDASRIDLDAVLKATG